MSQWIDVHAHLNMLKDPVDVSIPRAQEQGIHRIITIGTEPEDHGFVTETAKAHFPVVSGTLGVHPHEAIKYNDEVEQFIRREAQQEYIVAVAEIGLDYYYDNSPRERQREVFASQLQIASDLDMPFQIHTRDAEEDTVQILRQFEGRVKGIIHCFTGTQWLADQCLDMGFNISFSGIITFKNAQPLRDVVANVPLERMHVETDSPFLTPVPERGQPNSPERVLHTARKVAEIKGIDLSALELQMRKNAEEMFPKLKL